MNAPVPPDFLAKMQTLLGEAYLEFVQSYDAPGQAGLRVNTLKITPADFSRIAPFTLTPAGDWDAAAFHIQNFTAKTQRAQRFSLSFFCS